MKIIPDMRRAHRIRSLCFYCFYYRI